MGFLKFKRFLQFQEFDEKLLSRFFRNLPKFIILGSDGLFDVFKNQEICDYTKLKLKEHHYGARSLMKKAYARNSTDNITAIVIKFIKPKAKKPPKPSYDLTSNTYEWLK